MLDPVSKHHVVGDVQHCEVLGEDFVHHIAGGFTVEQVHDSSKIDPWFVDQMLMIVEERAAPE